MDVLREIYDVNAQQRGFNGADGSHIQQPFTKLGAVKGNSSSTGQETFR